MDCATVVNRDWATVGINYEVWEVDSGTWADQGYNIQGVPGNPGPSGISAITDSSFAIPAVGSHRINRGHDALGGRRRHY